MKLIFWGFILITVVKGSNIFGNRTVSGILERHKRDDTSRGTLKIRYQLKEYVKLIVLKKVEDTTLASSMVPIWGIYDENTNADQYEIEKLHPTFYHGIDSFSALTYFPHTETLHGVIDSKLYIENLHIQNVEDPQIVNQYIQPIPDFEPLEGNNPFRIRRSNEYPETQDEKNEKRKLDESSKEASPQKKLKINDDPKKILYPEILLVVDVSSRIDPSIAHRYEKAVMYVFAYWNAVDMLFRQFKRTEIKINIAGLVIGKFTDVPYAILGNVADYRISNSHLYIKKERSLEHLGRYFYRMNMVARDSYDFLVWMTSGTLVDENHAHRRIPDIGISAPPAESGGMHDDETRDEIISNRAIVSHNEKYGGYQTAARELAHMMFVSNDDVEISYDGRNFNCSPSDLPNNPSNGIMDPVNKQIEAEPMWSFCSEIHLENYANSKHSCGLLNYPMRTMPWQSHHEIRLTVESQCECYKMHIDYNQELYGNDFCNGLLHCVTAQGESVAVGKPLDGTPCLKNEDEGDCVYHHCL